MGQVDDAYNSRFFLYHDLLPTDHPSMSDSAAHVNMGTAQSQAWAQAMELEKRLKSESRKRSFWDPEVRRLRLSLQQAYEAVIFVNYEFAVVSPMAVRGMGAMEGR